MKRAVVIYGPTATGKTDLALQIAKKYQGELISADSRQVYKDLDIGTGKISPKSDVIKHQKYWIVDNVKINGFDLVPPGQMFSVAEFLKFASGKMSQIRRSKKLPIVVGGTGFYIKSLIEGLDSLGISPDLKLRKQLENLSVTSLYQKLLQINKKRAKTMNKSDRANPRRLIRAIEIGMNDKYQVHNKYKILNAKSLLIGLTAPNSYLYKRADNWLEKRLDNGLIEEIQSLVKKGINSDWLESLGLEYRWLTRFILGKIGFEKALERLRGDVHSFIRRQKTYFKKFDQIKLFDISKSDWQSKLEKTVKYWYTTGENG